PRLVSAVSVVRCASWTESGSWSEKESYPMLFLMLLLAAGLEIGGDAAIRHGLLSKGWSWLALGAAILAAYGFMVTLNRLFVFGRVRGLSIAVFFVVSQLLSFFLFGERPGPSLLVGGVLIVGGGLVIHLGGG